MDEGCNSKQETDSRKISSKNNWRIIKEDQGGIKRDCPS